MTAQMVLAGVGLQREAAILGAEGVRIVTGGGDAVGLKRRLAKALNDPPRPKAILSFGLAGALESGLQAGALIVGDGVVTPDGLVMCDLPWRDALLRRLPDARLARFIGVDQVAATAAVKRALRNAHGADAVDMESHVLAEAARAYGLPFAIVRAVSDNAEASLPPAALAGFAPDGGVDVPAVLRALLVRPWDLPGLIRTGLDVEKGFSALLRGRRRLGFSLGLADV